MSSHPVSIAYVGTLETHWLPDTLPLKNRRRIRAYVVKGIVKSGLEKYNNQSEPVGLYYELYKGGNIEAYRPVIIIDFINKSELMRHYTLGK